MRAARIRYLQIRVNVIAGVVSLLFGILGMLAVNYLTQVALRVVYDVTSMEVFPGKTKNLGILALQVANTAGKAIENVQCQVEL